MRRWALKQHAASQWKKSDELYPGTVQHFGFLPFNPCDESGLVPGRSTAGQFPTLRCTGRRRNARPIQTVNEVLPGYTISYTPAAIDAPDRKKARIALVLVPSDHGKLEVFDPKPAAEAADWKVSSRTQIITVIFGPRGLSKGKVNQLLSKNEELAGQMADYAQKTQQTEALIKAITQDQTGARHGPECKRGGAGISPISFHLPHESTAHSRQAPSNCLRLFVE